MHQAADVKEKREHSHGESVSTSSPTRPQPGKRPAVARTYGAAPGRAPAGASRNGVHRPLLGPGWGTFMPRLDPIGKDDEEPIEPDGPEQTDRETGEEGEAEPEESGADIGAQEARGDSEPEGAESTDEDGDREGGDSEEDEDAGESAGDDRGEAAEPFLAAEIAASDAVEVSDGADAASAGDAASAVDTARGDDDDGDEEGGGLRLASAGNGRATGGSTDADDQPRATAARLGPIDPPIPPPPRRRRKRPFVSLLGGKGWRKVGLPGVRLKRVGPAAILAIDRTNSRISLDTTKVRGKFSLPRQAKKQGAEIALNGDLFNFDTGKPSGLHRRHGKTLSGTKRQPWIGMFAFGRGRAGILSGKNRLPSWARNVVSGRPIVLRNGRVVGRYPSRDAGRLNTPNGRSAVGLSRSGRVLFLAASSASTTKQMARLLKKSGADDGLALDGSGSAQMYVKGKMVKSGDRRQIGNAILVDTD
jgi:uncharacterized protein YigE (DUF2233 family)